MRGEDEYIDYSCSTPLERLARDVETLLRSWHIVEGSDRHVSFHHKASQPIHHHSPTNADGNANNHPTHSKEIMDNKNVQSKKVNVNGVVQQRQQKVVKNRYALPPSGDSHVTEMRRKFSFDNNGKKSIASTSTSNSNSPTSVSTKYSTPPNSPPRSNDNKSKEKVDNYDDNDKSDDNKNDDNNDDASSKREKFHTPGRTPMRKDDDDNNSTCSKDSANVSINSGSGNNSSTNDIQLIRSAKVILTTIPLHSNSHKDRIQIELELCLWDGPPSTHHDNEKNKQDSSSPLSSPLTTPKTSPSTNSTTKSNQNKHLPLSLISNRNSNSLHFSNILSNLSHLFGIGQHITLSPTSQSTINTSLHTAMDALLNAQIPSRWEHFSRSIFSKGRTDEDEVALHSTALHTLSNQLQMALNTATSACDCRIPAFGIWGLYKSSVMQQQQHQSNMNALLSSPTKSANGQQQQQQQLTLSQCIMGIPAWMNAGNLFNVTAESSSIGAFLRYMETMREEDNDSISVDLNSSMDSHSEDGLRPDNSYIHRSPIRSQRKVTTPSHLLTTPPRNSSSRFKRKKKGNFGQELHLPAFISGNCHPGPSFFGIGASFAIHVVPPGVSYPIHCTTLNSLGQLLLQHCPSVSLSGVLKLQLDTKSTSYKKKTSSASSSSASTRMPKKLNFEDRNIQGKVAVVGARHKYTWSNIFQYSEDYIQGQDDMLLSSPTSYRYIGSWDDLNVLTYGLSWRSSCEMDVSEFQLLSGRDEKRAEKEENEQQQQQFDTYLNSIIQYRRQCRVHAMKLLYQVSCIAKTRRSKKSLVLKKCLEPLWGPTSDPIAMVSVGVTWGGNNNAPNLETGGQSGKRNAAPLLTLPLRIRSHNTMSSQDVLEMENTILSTIFNPLSVSPSDFLVSLSYDPEAACTTLSANNRCLLAALIRACTLESDTLMAHITRSNILEELHDRHELDFVAEEIMEKAALSPVTRKLVEVMDWGSMADMMDADAWGNEERLQEIIDQIFLSSKYPSPPEAVFNPSHTASDALHSETLAQSCIEKACPHGRLLSVLFTAMASLQTPSAMSALWMTFVSAMRFRWEQRERLHNCNNVPGIDDFISDKNLCTRRKKRHCTNNLGRSAKNAAFANSTEPEPDLNECLINQKLQVFNIGVETMVAMEMKQMHEMDNRYEEKEIHQLAPQSLEDNVDSSQPITVRINIENEDTISTGDFALDDNDESCDFKSCNNLEDDYQDAVETVGIISSRPEQVVLKEQLRPPSPLRIQTSTGVAPTETRKGARCPVQGESLIVSGDQLYAPYLQRELPLTDDILNERRRMLADNSHNSVENRIEISHRLQKPKLLNDMSAFKAANPGALFQDFTDWYGNPENPLEMYDDGDIFNSTEFLAPTKNKSAEEAMNEAILVLNATRTFWPETWDEAEPIPAVEQKPLFDAYSTVEMLLLSLESMHPSVLLNQILAVNLSMANFVLRSSAPSCRVKTVDNALDRMERSINDAVLLLSKDVASGSTISNEDIGRTNPFKFISTQTIAACEHACTYIADVEILLSRATSLLSKFSGDSDLVETFLKRNIENRTFQAQSFASRSGILKAVYTQQQNNSGKIIGGVNDLPEPSVREYILHNRDEKSPCQLTVCIGGIHGLEKGGTNSTKGGLVLALNKCVKGIQ